MQQRPPTAQVPIYPLAPPYVSEHPTGPLPAPAISNFPQPGRTFDSGYRYSRPVVRGGTHFYSYEQEEIQNAHANHHQSVPQTVERTPPPHQNPRPNDRFQADQFDNPDINISEQQYNPIQSSRFQYPSNEQDDDDEFEQAQFESYNGYIQYPKAVWTSNAASPIPFLGINQIGDVIQVIGYPDAPGKPLPVLLTMTISDMQDHTDLYFTPKDLEKVKSPSEEQVNAAYGTPEPTADPVEGPSLTDQWIGTVAGKDLSKEHIIPFFGNFFDHERRGFFFRKDGSMEKIIGVIESDNKLKVIGTPRTFGDGLRSLAQYTVVKDDVDFSDPKYFDLFHFEAKSAPFNGKKEDDGIDAVRDESKFNPEVEPKSLIDQLDEADERKFNPEAESRSLKDQLDEVEESKFNPEAESKSQKDQLDALLEGEESKFNPEVEFRLSQMSLTKMQESDDTFEFSTADPCAREPITSTLEQCAQKIPVRDIKVESTSPIALQQHISREHNKENTQMDDLTPPEESTNSKKIDSTTFEGKESSSLSQEAKESTYPATSISAQHSKPGATQRKLDREEKKRLKKEGESIKHEEMKNAATNSDEKKKTKKISVKLARRLAAAEQNRLAQIEAEKRRLHEQREREQILQNDPDEQRRQAAERLRRAQEEAAEKERKEQERLRREHEAAEEKQRIDDERKRKEEKALALSRHVRDEEAKLKAMKEENKRKRLEEKLKNSQKLEKKIAVPKSQKAPSLHRSVAYGESFEEAFLKDIQHMEVYLAYIEPKRQKMAGLESQIKELIDDSNGRVLELDKTQLDQLRKLHKQLTALVNPEEVNEMYRYAKQLGPSIARQSTCKNFSKFFKTHSF
jgi:hypothetical protein